MTVNRHESLQLGAYRVVEMRECTEDNKASHDGVENNYVLIKLENKSIIDSIPLISVGIW